VSVLDPLRLGLSPFFEKENVQDQEPLLRIKDENEKGS